MPIEWDDDGQFEDLANVAVDVADLEATRPL